MAKIVQKFDSITHFIQTGGFDYRVYEMGRKILPLSKGQFQQIEDQQMLYPFPFQQKAWLALLIWQPDNESEAVIWFLQFPVDELGYLKQEARDAFLIELLGQAGKNIQAKQKNNAIMDELGESPFAFKPREDRLAMFHALASKELGQGASPYYQATREYLAGALGYEQWQFLGLQGIADVVARLDEEDNEALLLDAIAHMPNMPLESFSHALENVFLQRMLVDALIQRLQRELAKNNPDNGTIEVSLVAALVRAISASQIETVRIEILKKVLASSFSKEIEVLVAISGRSWVDLENEGLLSLFLEKLALQNQLAFNAVIIDLMMLPDMKEKVLKVLRGAGRSSMLSERLDGFMVVMKGLQDNH